MALQWSIAKVLGVQPTKTQSRPLPRQASPSTNTACTITVPIPTDHFIHKILLKVGYNSVTTAIGTLADDITEARLIGDGSKYFKKMLGTMIKAIQIVNFEGNTTGYYIIYLKDPRIEASKPLPAWLFTTLNLELDLPAGGSSQYVVVEPTIIEEFYNNQDLTNWKVLVEKYPGRTTYGTSTGEQTYLHERAYDVYGYLYRIDDQDTASATIFDYLTLKAIARDGEWNLRDKANIPLLVQENLAEFKAAFGTGFFMVEFPQGLPSHQYTSLKSILNIPSAGTVAGVRVLERYLL